MVAGFASVATSYPAFLGDLERLAGDRRLAPTGSEERR